MRALVLALLVACSSQKSVNDLPPEAWSTSEYTSAGVPAPDHTWTLDEHEAAAKALATAVTGGHRERLPRLRGAKSGTVFARIIERSSSADIAADANAAFIAHARRFDAARQISELYIVNDMAGVTAEYLAIAGMMLHEAAVLEQGSQPFLDSFGADDPQRPARLDGIAEMRSGWGQMVLGGLMLLGDVRVAESARVALANDLRTVMPLVVPKLDANAQGQIRAQLDMLHQLVMKPGALRDALPPKS